MKLYIEGFTQINKKVLIPLLFIAIFTLVAFPRAILAQDDQAAWKNNWGVLEGFAIVKDTEGYTLPSAISFVPNPGSGPKDPLYFVTELRGTIKVITNDRTVLIFAEDFFNNESERGLDGNADEFVMAGICLDPEHGYVFVTYAYRGSDNKLRNSIARFKTSPVTFSTRPIGTADFNEIFRIFKTDASHQIGGCQVYDGLLYVTVGDSLNEEAPPIALESLRGKVLRLTLDGEPVSDNPYYLEDDPLSTVNYVWATGFRNPFGIEVVNGRVFVADNGRNLDRFLEVLPGQDYLWNGSDWSIGTSADVTFSPAIGPTQVDYYPAGIGILPEQYDDSFFIAMTGVATRGIVNVRYDFSGKAVNEVPQVLLRYIGPLENYYAGIVASMAVGPDGLYFAPMVEDGVETGVVYRIYYDPSNAHPFTTDDINNPEIMLTTLECLACHSINNQGGQVAPSLDYLPLVERLQERLHTDEYLASLDEIDLLRTEPFTSHRADRHVIRQTEGLERVRYWIYFHILEPKFDNPESQMPNLGLTKEQSQLLTNYLVPPPSRKSESQAPDSDPSQTPTIAEVADPSTSSNPLVRLIAPLIPILGYRHLLVFFIVGVLAGMLFLWLVGWLRAKRSSD
ncbi:MAG: PQQ-dependent sugar dehydrogenase [Chloroflexi bacterium]|nr:PQQ-dependent sugar dehydrogenase [Chloroflexota bacterium]